MRTTPDSATGSRPPRTWIASSNLSLASVRPPVTVCAMGDGDERIPDPASPPHARRLLDEVVPEVDEGPEPEPPSLELWSEVGDVRPSGTLLLLLAWAAMFALSGAFRAFSQPGGLWALGASATGMPAGESAWRLIASTFLHA